MKNPPTILGLQPMTPPPPDDDGEEVTRVYDLGRMTLRPMSFAPMAVDVPISPLSTPNVEIPVDLEPAPTSAWSRAFVGAVAAAMVVVGAMYAQRVPEVRAAAARLIPAQMSETAPEAIEVPELAPHAMVPMGKLHLSSAIPHHDAGAAPAPVVVAAPRPRAHAAHAAPPPRAAAPKPVAKKATAAPAVDEESAAAAKAADALAQQQLDAALR